MSKDITIDEVCKYYELRENQKLLTGLPVIIRLDGKNFHKFTKDMKRPYDTRLSSLMYEALKFCMKETSAIFGYTQSDELSLLLYNREGQIYYDGKPYKINSILASKLSLFFNKSLESFDLKDFKHLEPVFDCRCFAIPHDKVPLVFKWRYIDAIRNSIQMAARSEFSHTECHKKSTKQLHEMLYKKGINWAKYPIFFKNGQFITKTKVEKVFTLKEIDKLPISHKARTNPELTVVRTNYIKTDIEDTKTLSMHLCKLI